MKKAARESKSTEKICGVKMADGKPCVLDAGHNPTEWWEKRIHRTVEGTEFTWKQGQQGLPTGLPAGLGFQAPYL